MSTQQKSVAHPIVAAKLPKPALPLASRVEGIANAVEGNKEIFAATPTEVTTARTDIASLRQWILAADARSAGAVAARNREAGLVRHDGYALAHLVQTAANKLPYDAGVKLILGSLLDVSRVGMRNPKPPLAISYGGVPGSVRAMALASKVVGATYVFEYSIDGKTWVALPVTPLAKAFIPGLNVGQVYDFRVHAIERCVARECSPVVTFLVR